MATRGLGGLGGDEHKASSFGSGRAEMDRQADLQLDTLPEPIYMSNKLLNQIRQAYLNRDDELSSGEEEDDEGNLDLSAPPLESWFHGRISRQTACERLDMVGDCGSYLVRESIHEPKDYALSYLSHTGHVHHFKINSNCGDYYIGGRQFFSLGDLIGFYANCSCILENESLELPVVPPKPVALYLMLRATTQHIKTPGTDELSILPGEVFLLLSKLNDDWGWGRSQRTGESGLIPIVIMEDVTDDEDPNLGKPWYHGNISRDGVVDLVMRSEVGGFIVRFSGGGGGPGGDELRYSMAVRTPDKVQKFLITRYITGYYLFGGRPFNSIDDIIDRYKNEVILDGLKLGSPVPMEVTPSEPLKANSVTEFQGPRHRSNSNAITHDTSRPGDKAGIMQLRKGKKCPVYGKWKDFYFVLKYNEQKLLFYEHENSHRAKGLLDLKQCRVYAVHPSVYGRADCFVVMLRYLNELSFHYISAQTPESAKEWVCMLRQCTATHQGDSAEVLQSRSLSLTVKECRSNVKGCSQVFGLVFIDGVCLARTSVLPESPFIFDENFTFEDLPQYAESFICEIQSNKSKRLPNFGKAENSLGRVHVHMSDLPNGTEDDQWHQLVGAGAKTAKVTLRLVANFKDYVILPLDEYMGLKELILSDDLVIIELLAQVCKEHHAELASTLIQIFCSYNQIVPIITGCLAKSIEKEENMGTLFRASTLSTMLMDQFMKLTASPYLHTILKDPIQQIIECQDSCEINTSYLMKGEDPAQNLSRLECHLQHVVSSIFKSVDACPPTLRYIFRSLQEQVVQKWPTDESVRIRAVSGFLFLRFVCPSLLKPQLFGLVNGNENPSPKADRTLKLVTKGVQNLANMVEFKSKEDFTMALNPFIQRNQSKMRKFVDDVANYSQTPSPVDIPGGDPRRDLASILHLCSTYEKSLQNLLSKQPEIKRLLSVIQMLRKVEKKYTNKSVS